MKGNINLKKYISLLLLTIFLQTDVFAQNDLQDTTNPIPNLNVQPNKVNFGKTFINSLKEKDIKIKNIGSSDIEIVDITLTSDSNFFILSESTPFTLNPNKEKTIKIQFLPDFFKKYTSTLLIKDLNGNITKVELTGEGSPINIASDKGKIVDYQLLHKIPFPQNAPSFNGKFYPNYIVSFLIDTQDHSLPNQNVKITLQFQNLPKNAVFYKINSRTGEWRSLTGVVISKNSINYTLTDNSDLDSDDRIGYIQDPVVIGVIKANETSGVVTQPPPLGGGSGGCSMGKDMNVNLILLVLFPILFLSIRRFSMKKAFISIISLYIFFIYSCGGTGDGTDVGVTVFVNATASSANIDSDLLLHLKGDDDLCGTPDDEIYIPPSETININFSSTPLHEDIATSPVKVESVQIIYTRKSGTLIDRTDFLNVGYTFDGTGTLHIPVISKSLKSEILSGGEAGEYYVTMIFKMNEVEYNKNLETRIGFTLTVDNLHQEGECP